MKARPILFRPSMVRALLDGRKTQTRRMIKKLDPTADGDIEECDVYVGEFFQWKHEERQPSFHCPYGDPGDLLWVRETFKKEDDKYYYLADWGTGPLKAQRLWKNEETGQRHFWPKWKPSIHMPRVASRLTLEIINVRVERLQNISNQDALAEGIESTEFWREEHPPSICFSVLFNRINGPDIWNSNPWVWVIEFKVHHKNIGEFDNG